MNIQVQHNERTYVFHSQDDVTKAEHLYNLNTGTLDNFEDELRENFIEFEIAS